MKKIFQIISIFIKNRNSFSPRKFDLRYYVYMFGSRMFHDLPDVLLRIVTALSTRRPFRQILTVAAVPPPVSYTHLDVYKRQAYRLAGQGGMLHAPHLEQFLDPLQEAQFTLCLLYTSRCV